MRVFPKIKKVNDNTLIGYVMLDDGNTERPIRAFLGETVYSINLKIALSFIKYLKMDYVA